MASERSKRTTELQLALGLSAGLAVILFSFALVAKHFMI
jgi:hypothetical protein